MNLCSKCDQTFKENELAACDGCKTFLCQVCADLTSTELRAISLKKRQIVYNCVDCKTLKKANVDSSSVAQSILKDLTARLPMIITKCLEHELDKVNIGYQEVKEEVVLLRESNIELIHMLTSIKNPVVNNTYAAAAKTTTSLQSVKHQKHDKVPEKKNSNQSSENLAKLTNITDKTSATHEMPMPMTKEAPEEGFKTVRRRNKHKTVRVGTGIGALEDNFGFEGSSKSEDRKLWIFIKKVKDNVSEEQIGKYISKKANTTLDQMKIKKVKTFYEIENNNCFLVGVNPDLKDTVYQMNFWPRGVQFDRFNFYRGQHFLDNPRPRHQKEGNLENDFLLQLQ